MKIIVGLGNPGEKYKNNRHNVGQMFIDYLLATFNPQLVTQESKKLHVICHKLQGLILAKPLTFMNNSGAAINELIKTYHLKANKLKANNLVVVHDDLDIPLGKFKIQMGTGPLLHNGVESVEKILGTKNFLRVRIGVDNRVKDKRIDGETYVLNDFTPNEKEIILELFAKILLRLMFHLRGCTELAKVSQDDIITPKKINK